MGASMSIKKIPITQVLIGDEEIKACTEVLRSGKLREGEKTREFEQAFRMNVGTKHAIATSSGTSALHLAYLAMIKPGDEVLLPTFTFIATASMVVMAGGIPVFCDVDPETWTLDPAEIEKKLTDKTRAIVGVHLFGNACDIARIERQVAGKNVKLIWDAAQSLGTRYQAKDVGQFPDAVCYSFYPTKNMTTGEGGMITTNNDDIAAKVRLLKSHGESGKYVHTMIGFNYRMTEMEAALGLFQLSRLDDFLVARKKIAAQYEEGFKNNPFVKMQRKTPGSEPSYNYFSILLQIEKMSVTRDQFVSALEKEGIQCAVYYPQPLDEQPCFAAYRNETLPNSKKLSSQILALPMYPLLSGEDVQYVIDTVNRLTRQFSHTSKVVLS